MTKDAALHPPRRILIINPDLPIFPGRAMHEYLNTVGLRSLGYRVGLVSALHAQYQAEALESLTKHGVELFLWRSPHLHQTVAVGNRGEKPLWRRRLAHIWLRTWDALRDWRRPKDTKFADYIFRNLAEPLQEALNAGPWDVVIVIQSTFARWIDYLPRQLFSGSVLVFHDVRTRVYEQRSELGTWWQRLADAWESRRYRRFESEYGRRFDLAITVSEVDEAYARDRLGLKNLVTVPIPIDPEYFHPLPEHPEVPGRIVFTGTMNHPPNVDAAVYFAREVFPAVRRVFPQAEFWIVGRDPAPEVQALADLPGVVVTGFVPDIRTYIASADVVVVPLRYGAGMRNKILEAWGMAKCIISTSLGAEGLHYRDGEHLLIADSAEEMVAQISRVFRHPELKARIKAQGRQLVFRDHHPTIIANQYAKAIRQAYQRGRARRARPRRFVFDLHWMYPGVAGGIENLTRSFLAELMALDRESRYVLFGPRVLRYTLDLRYSPNFSFYPLEITHSEKILAWLKQAAARIGAPIWRTDAVRHLFRLRDLEGVVSYSPSGYVHPLLRPLRNVVLVPDIQHEYHPEFFTPEQLAIRRRVYKEAVDKAAHVCAISEFTRQSLIERYGVPPEKVTTTYLAADPLYQRPLDPQVARRVVEKYHLPPGEYLYYPANTWHHKNHITLFRALTLLRDRYHFRPLLVLTGAPKEAHEKLMRFIQEEQLEGQVRFLGYLPVEDLPALYAQALMLVYPSLFEGFGMPVLEAMWSGAPVVASRVSSIPEVAGEAAILLPPEEPGAWAEAIYQVATDSTLRQELIARGRIQARRFSWQRFTVQTLRILNRVYDEE